MTRSEAEVSESSARRAWNLGVRARLLLAFFGIAVFAVLAAAAGLYAFREVGGRLDVIDTRVPPALSALELSRSAERIIAAAPALLAATDRTRRDEVKAELAAEAERLIGKLAELRSEEAQPQALETIEPIVFSLTASLGELDGLVARRLETSERIRALRREVFQTSAEVQRLLAPWLRVLDGQISAFVEGPQEAAPDEPGGGEQRLASLTQLQRLTQTAQHQASATVDMLAEASTTEQARRLPILDFQLDLALRDLVETSAGLAPKLRPLFLEQVAKLRAFVEGPDAIVEARKLELTLVGEGEKRLAEAASLSAQLTAAVDQLGSAAKQDVGEAIRDALWVQRLSARALVALVGLSLLTSVLIVWLYVGGNIVRRLTALSDGMLAIAGGRLRTTVAAQGTDEIAAMGRAVEIFRQNTLERDALLAEKAQAADLLEKEVKQRTAELAQSVEELRALGEVSQAVNSTVDLETVLTTIVAKATQLSNTEAGAIYVFDDATRQLQLRATYGMDEAVVASLRNHPLRLGETTLSEVVERSVPIQIPDNRSTPSSQVPDVILRAGYRALLLVPLLAADQVVGALVIQRKHPGEFPRSTVELLQTFAAQSVLAIQNARLFAEVEEKGRQLETANKYKSHFLASASHDLRQPLHALNLFVAQLRTESDLGERNRLVDRVDAAVSSMNELFDLLLDMSKLEAGILEPHLAEVPIERAFKRIETTFADSAKQKGLRLSVVPSGAWVRSDLVLLERVLMNLVSNAVRYTACGGIVVGCRRRGGRLRIDVCDTGPGIPQEQQQSIFGEYYRLAATEPDRGGGFGLGLAIVDRLGRLLNHEVELESRPGRGSRFSVWIPLVAEPHGAAEAPVPPEIADPARGKLVVVIDDDALVLEGMGGILRNWGCHLLTADSEEAALSSVAAQRRRPDLIISDYRLANGTTGIQAIERLRGELGAAIPAFLISGDTAPERLRDASEKGFHLLHKPVPPMRLRAMLNRLLKPHHAAEVTAPVAE